MTQATAPLSSLANKIHTNTICIECMHRTLASCLVGKSRRKTFSEKGEGSSSLPEPLPLIKSVHVHAIIIIVGVCISVYMIGICICLRK